jgi:NADH-quinone oxidoreductase subunit G
VGSNAYAHVLRGEVRRMVPRDNDAINETWLADRDRFSCHGLYAGDRLTRPMIKSDQEWNEVSWQEALAAARGALEQSRGDEGDSLGVLVSPSATLEEMYLLSRITRHLGSHNIDHRLRRRDFRDEAADPPWPWLGCSIAELECQQGILVVGSDLRAEVPILAHRIRKAATNGAKVGFVNPLAYQYHFATAAFVEAPLATFARALAGVLVAAVRERSRTLPDHLDSAVAGIEPSDADRAAAAVLLGHERALLLLGHIAQRHPAFAEIRAVAAALAHVTDAELGYLAEGANGVGAALTGLLPHRGVGAEPLEVEGLNARAMISAPRRAYVLFGLEPDLDMAEGALAEQALKSADQVVCFTSFVSDSLRECADVLLPIATFAETAGTYVNCEGRWQTFEAAADLQGEARPGWRVLRVLGNELALPDCEYRSADDVRAALTAELGGPAIAPDNAYRGNVEIGFEPHDVAASAVDVPMYSIDPLVRRSEALQQTAFARHGTPVEGAEPAHLAAVGRLAEVQRA